VNSRLQVEHPVTEMRAGVDLVKEQLQIAAGEGIGFDQNDVELKGAAMECRINAEDPAMGFAPSGGRIEKLFFPGGAGLRIDTAIFPGYEVPEYYDSLLAKLVVYGNNLDEARTRMSLALAEFEIEGVKTTLPLQRFLLEHKELAHWNLDVQFLQRNRIVESLLDQLQMERDAIIRQGAAIAAVILEAGIRGRPTIHQAAHAPRQAVPPEARFYDTL
jgi:acetyl-CoA carboxylase biotin carboxylase subunit